MNQKFEAGDILVLPDKTLHILMDTMIGYGEQRYVLVGTTLHQSYWMPAKYSEIIYMLDHFYPGVWRIAKRISSTEWEMQPRE